ncbi:MAG TPA: hypothetical protein VGK19_00765 [Capsulimonadaceae bacterium]
MKSSSQQTTAGRLLAEGMGYAVAALVGLNSAIIGLAHFKYGHRLFDIQIVANFLMFVGFLMIVDTRLCASRKAPRDTATAARVAPWVLPAAAAAIYGVLMTVFAPNVGNLNADGRLLVQIANAIYWAGITVVLCVFLRKF